MGNVKAFSKVHHCVGDVEVAVEERVGDSLVTDKRLTVSLVNSHVHRLCYFFPEAETIILLLFFCQVFCSAWSAPPQPRGTLTINWNFPSARCLRWICLLFLCHQVEIRFVSSNCLLCHQ